MKAKDNKNKKKHIKLKTVLANPYKITCPTLNDVEMKELKVLLHTTIKKSGEEPRTFATANHICLGLESSLRAIKNCRSSCVFLSLNIKPRHIVHLVARNAEVQDATVPLYAQPKLEDFIEELFGVRALALVLPSDTSGLSEELQNWIAARKKNPKIKVAQPTVVEGLIQIPKKTKDVLHQKNKKNITTEVTTSSTSKPEETKSWEDDFISFSNTEKNVKLDKLNIDEDKNKMLGVLGKMAKKAQEQKEKVVQATSQREHNKVTYKQNDDMCSSKMDTATSDCDDFLQKYQPLSVNKIGPNPNKKLKIPRKNKKKKTK